MHKGKKINRKWRKGVCEVEKLIDKDNKNKRTFYCGECKIWMCVPCSKNILKRAMAMILRDINKKVKL